MNIIMFPDFQFLIKIFFVLDCTMLGKADA